MKAQLAAVPFGGSAASSKLVPMLQSGIQAPLELASETTLKDRKRLQLLDEVFDWVPGSGRYILVYVELVMHELCCSLRAVGAKSSDV